MPIPASPLLADGFPPGASVPPPAEDSVSFGMVSGPFFEPAGMCSESARYGRITP